MFDGCNVGLNEGCLTAAMLASLKGCLTAAMLAYPKGRVMAEMWA